MLLLEGRNSITRYDCLTKSITRCTTDLRMKVGAAYCVTPNQRLFVLGGKQALRSCFEILLPSSDGSRHSNIEPAAKYKFKSRASMSIERWAHSVTYLRDELLIVTGTTFADQLSKKAECYIIESNHWQVLPDLNEGRAGHASCGFRARSVFVFCGFVITGSSF